MELSESYALSGLIGRPACDASGCKLGRVFERGPGAKARAIPWAQVSEIGERIVVAG